MDQLSREDEDRQDGTAEVDGSAWDCMANWTQAERDYWFMGPFDGGIPGTVRRIRRILDVSQRGLAAILEVSQSVVARWETGRTSPRASVVERLLRLARLQVTVRDEDGREVGPMRADGARTHGGSRFPAHVDLCATGWWVPRRLRAMTSIERTPGATGPGGWGTRPSATSSRRSGRGSSGSCTAPRTTIRRWISSSPRCGSWTSDGRRGDRSEQPDGPGDRDETPRSGDGSAD